MARDNQKLAQFGGRSRLQRGGLPRPQGVPKSHVLVYTNAQGGPRIVGKKDHARLDDPTIDGKNPDFKWMAKKEADDFVFRYHNARERLGIRQASASIKELQEIDKKDIMDSEFYHLESRSGKRPPYDRDPFYRDVEMRLRAGMQLEQHEYDRLDREKWECKIAVTVKRQQPDPNEHVEIMSEIEAEAVKDTIKRRVAEKLARGYSDLPQELPPGMSPLEAKRDKDMLKAIMPKLENGKPLTPGQHRFLQELAERYEAAGMPLPTDVLGVIDTVEVMGKGKPAQWPTLADAKVHAKFDPRGLVTKKETYRLNGILKNAPKFVLSPQATGRIAEALKAYPEQVVDNGEFALPPFETCWIEYPNHAMADALGFEMTPMADVRTGFLFHAGQVFVCSQNPQMATPEWTPVSYQLNCNPLQGRLVEEGRRIGIADREHLDLFYWGKTMADMVGEDYRIRLRAAHGFRVLPGVTDLPPNAWMGLASDVPVILAILLTLNTPSKQVIQYADQPRRSRQTHRGKVALHAHRIVTIDMDKAPSVRLIAMETDTAREKRHIGWHEVRGHFVHDKRYREVERDGTCDHGGQGGDWWCEFEPKKWECLNCGAKRTWREYPNGRGDRDKPVTHHYVVKG